MSTGNVDTDALARAAAALGNYIEEVQNDIQKLRDAATDCSDNMGSDVYSQNAVRNLTGCLTELSRTIREAEALRQRILDRKRKIEESGRV